MKIQLDTTVKTIKLENSVKMSDLVDILEKLLPGGEWKEFSLDVSATIINWTTPYIVERKTYPSYPWHQPWYCGTITPDPNVVYCSSAESNAKFGDGMSNSIRQLQSGTFCVEVKD